ncbi:unnamed protein product [Didymodactylos carnosus]|uniref:PH domain-containing protein n=1 Tax=Didymodactylos carnosus TaxID=1234261 RepID=A0A8S2DGB1_9BILA|nr:unnamed protein product [Didymodactylos carnosus]CAF3699797.1 unnamed protein product [Didymodactylos carnosus]
MKTPGESMASIDMNMNEILPGLESFLRSMLHNKHLDKDHRQVATMYIDKLDRLIKNTKASQQFSSNNENNKQRDEEQQNKLLDDLKQQLSCYNDQTASEQKTLNLNTTNRYNILSHHQDGQPEEIVFDDDSDDFTDEEEEEEQRQQQLKQQQNKSQNGYSELNEKDESKQSEKIIASTPIMTRHALNNHIYDSRTSISNKSNHSSHSQWYIDTPKNGYLEALKPINNNNNNNDDLSHVSKDDISSIPNTPRLSTSTSPSIIADGLLLTYENQKWIWRYYVLDDYDLICFTTDKKTNDTPLWVTDITGAKVQTTIIDKTECLCLQIGLSEAIYVKPLDQSQLPIWLKAFRDASIAQTLKDNVNSFDRHKGRNNSVKSLSKNARRMFQQFNRKKGQIVSQLLDQVANVAGVDDKTRKHCELRGFLVISCDNIQFLTKYCTIVDGLFCVHKSRLSDQCDYKLCLQQCTLTFPEEKTRDIQFALIDHSSNQQQQQQLFIRGNNIYSMGRLLNTLAKYVEIVGSSQSIFSQQTTPIITKHRVINGIPYSSEPHIYSDVDSSSRTERADTISVVPSIMESQSITNIRDQKIYSPSSIKSLPVGKFNNGNERDYEDQSLNSNSQISPLKKKTIYRNASKLYGVVDDDNDTPVFLLPVRRHSNDTILNRNENTTNRPKQQKLANNENYDKPKSYDNIPEQFVQTPKGTLYDHNNNQLNKKKNVEQQRVNNSMTELPLNTSNVNHQKVRTKSPSKQTDHQHSDSISDSVSSSPDNSVFCLRTESSHRHSRRHHHNNNSNNNDQHSHTENRSVSSAAPIRNRKPNEIKSPTSPPSSDYVARLAHLLSRSFSLPFNSPVIQQKSENNQQQQVYNRLNEKDISTQTYSTYLDSQQQQQSPPKNVKQTSFRANNQNHNQANPYHTRLSRNHHLTPADISLPLPQNNDENYFTSHFQIPTVTKQNGWPENNRTLLQDVQDEINRKKREEEEENPYENRYDNCRKDPITPPDESHHYRRPSPPGMAKFRFVIPFNHSPTSPFGTITTTTNKTPSQNITNFSKSNSSSPCSTSSYHSSSTVCDNGSLSASMSTTESNSACSNYLNNNNSNINNNSHSGWSLHKAKQIQMKNYSSASTNAFVASTNNYNNFNQVTNGSSNTETEV